MRSKLPLKKPILFSRYLALATPIFMGVAYFLIVVGHSVLIPTNTSWLSLYWDPLSSYLGWEFFKSSNWSIPPGLNPLYGISISSSIVYSDSLPLMALLIKPLKGFFSDQLQYFGMWLLICFVSQAYFGFMLGGLLSKSIVIKALISAFFLFSPVMLWRVGIHTSLSSHFLILASLFLIFKTPKKRDNFFWAALLVGSVLIHFYIFIMCFALWVGNYLDKFFQSNAGPSNSRIGEPVLIITLILIFAWISGYFVLINSLSAVDIGKYGSHGLDLYSLISPQYSNFFGKFTVENFVKYEGFHYSGYGLLVLFLIAILIAIFGMSKTPELKFLSFRSHFFVYLFLLGMLLFSISNRLVLGDQVLPIFDLSESSLSLFSVFRASGRFAWPTYYALIFIAISIILFKLPNKISFLIILTCLIIQYIDIQQIQKITHSRFHERLENMTPLPFRNCIWKEFPARYSLIELIPLQDRQYQDNWNMFAQYAQRNQMATNFVYLARVDSNMVKKTNKSISEKIEQGRLDNNSMYIISDEYVDQVSKIRNSKDFFEKIDGFYVYAPNWDSRSECSLK